MILDYLLKVYVQVDSTFGLSFGVAVSCEILLEVKFLASGGYNPAVISASFFV